MQTSQGVGGFWYKCLLLAHGNLLGLLRATFQMQKIYKQKFILGLIYSRTTDFNGLSTVATVPGHQSMFF